MSKYAFPLSKFPAEPEPVLKGIQIQPEDIYLPFLSTFISSFIVYNVLSATLNSYSLYALMAITSSTSIYKYYKPDEEYFVNHNTTEKSYSRCIDRVQYSVLSGFKSTFIGPLIFLIDYMKCQKL